MSIESSDIARLLKAAYAEAKEGSRWGGVVIGPRIVTSAFHRSYYETGKTIAVRTSRWDLPELELGLRASHAFSEQSFDNIMNDIVKANGLSLADLLDL